MPSKWVEHVKNYASKNNMKYGEAMGNAECKREYHESKGSMEGGKFKLGKTLKKINTKVKDAVVSKEAGQYLNTVKKAGQVAKTGLNYVKKSGLAEYVPGGEELVDAGIEGVKYQNRGINSLQDKRRQLIEKRQERAARGGSFKSFDAGSFKSFDGGSFNIQGGALHMNDKYEAVYGNTNGIDRFAQSFYPNPNDSKSRAITMFGR
jgi:hypothetical protein